MTEIKLTKRYPQSRTEDITDAFMRGYEQGKTDGLKVGKQIVLGAFETYITADRKTEPHEYEKVVWHKDYGYIKDEPQTITIEGKMPLNEWRKICPENPQFKDEPQTESLEQFRVGLEYHTDTTHFGKVKGESITTNKVKDEPQTDCAWQNDEFIPTELASTMLKERFKEQK